MWMHALACLVLALSETGAISQRDCTSFNPTYDEDSMLSIYCTPATFFATQIVIGYPGNNKKFLVCTGVASGCSGTCPHGDIFDKTTKSCRSAPVVCPVPRGVNSNIQLQPLDRFLKNPCSKAGSKTCFLFNHSSKNRFIICERSTTQVPKVGQCMDGFEFNFNSQACDKIQGNIIACKNGQNPCKPIPFGQMVIDAHLLYFGCLDDPTMFIQCTRSGHMFVKQCKNKTIWSQKDITCVNK